MKKAEMKKKRRERFLKGMDNIQFRKTIYDNLNDIIKEFKIETNNPIKYYKNNILSNIEIFN